MCLPAGLPLEDTGSWRHTILSQSCLPPCQHLSTGVLAEQEQEEGLGGGAPGYLSQTLSGPQS